MFSNKGQAKAGKSKGTDMGEPEASKGKTKGKGKGFAFKDASKGKTKDQVEDNYWKGKGKSWILDHKFVLDAKMSVDCPYTNVPKGGPPMQEIFRQPNAG